MPNHCLNTLSIHGTTDDLRALAERIAAAQGFSFATFVPVPENVCEGDSGSTLIGRDATGAWVRVPWADQPDGARAPDPTGLTDVEHRPYHLHRGELVLEDEMRACGLVDWYSWRSEHWGTKWTAYNVDAHGRIEDGFVSFEFDTAWAPPVPVVLAMQAQHPSLAIHLHATEPNMAFQVTVTEEGGVLEEPYEMEDEVDRDDVDDLLDASAQLATPTAAVTP